MSMENQDGAGGRRSAKPRPCHQHPEPVLQRTHESVLIYLDGVPQPPGLQQLVSYGCAGLTTVVPTLENYKNVAMAHVLFIEQGYDKRFNRPHTDYLNNDCKPVTQWSHDNPVLLHQLGVKVSDTCSPTTPVRADNGAPASDVAVLQSVGCVDSYCIDSPHPISLDPATFTGTAEEQRLKLRERCRAHQLAYNRSVKAVNEERATAEERFCVKQHKDNNCADRCGEFWSEKVKTREVIRQMKNRLEVMDDDILFITPEEQARMMGKRLTATKSPLSEALTV